MKDWRRNIADYLVLFFFLSAASPAAGFVFHSHAGGSLSHSHVHGKTQTFQKPVAPFSVNGDELHLHHVEKLIALSVFGLIGLFLKRIFQGQRAFITPLYLSSRDHGCSPRAPPLFS